MEFEEVTNPSRFRFKFNTLHGVTGAIICMLAALLFGCNTLRVHSSLAGAWQIANAEAQSRNDVKYPLRIRDDGTIDFGNASVISGLRYSGDCATDANDVIYKMVWSEYTPTSSSLLVRSTWIVENQRVTRLNIVQVIMLADGSVHYWNGTLPTYNVAQYSADEYILKRERP